MVDAAVGGSATVGYGVESYLGIRGGDLYPERFISLEFARDSKENPSTAITGHGGRDRGTPGAVEFSGKTKTDLTCFRAAKRFAAMYGKPTVTAMKHVASVTVGGSGTSYTNGSVVTFSGGGATVQATGHVVTSGGNVTSLVVDTPGSGYTSVPTVAVADGTGNTFLAVLSTADAWLAKFRPGASAPTRTSEWVYVDEGGSYSGTVQYGRRPSDVSLAEDANKRIVMDVTYAPATGDTISGFPIAKSTNTGDFDNATTLLGKVSTRGRRPTVLPTDGSADTNWTLGKSLYLKVTAADANTVTVLAAYGTASGATDGTGFDTPTYGATTFVIRRPGSALAPDGYVGVVLSDGTIVGQFGENNEPYEISFGDQDLSGIDVNDVFEIPYRLAPGGVTLTPLAENRLSTFHTFLTIAGARQQFSKATLKLSRPFTPYYVNGRKLPVAIDPTGEIGVTLTLEKRLFDRFYREKQEQAIRFTSETLIKFNNPIYGSVYEGIHFFMPVLAVTAMKSGEITTKETLEETITLEAEQPETNPTAPDAVLAAAATFDASLTYPFQINIVSRVDLTPIAA